MTPDRRRASYLSPLDGSATGTTPLGSAVGTGDAVAVALADRRPGEVTGVLMLQLDRSEVLADAYGWALVDELAADVAGRLRTTIRADDRLVPAGRGTLCLVARSMPGQRDVALLAERVVRAAARPLALPDGVEHDVTVSVGAAIGRAGDRPAALLARAERLCRQVAEAGGARWSVEPVDPHPAASIAAAAPHRSVSEAAVARLRQAGELRQALAAHQLDLALTPLHPLLHPGGGAWLTVAVRWRHPVRGLLHPGAVVAAVIDAGLAGAYLETVLPLAASEAVDASVSAGHPVGVAVDLPLALAARARAQGTDLTASVAGAVARARLDPAQLALRVTVDDARCGDEVLIPTLDQLAGLGVTTVLTGVDPSPGTLAWLDTWTHASLWLLDRAVATALSAPAPSARPERAPTAPELAPAVILARAGAAAVVAAATARGLTVGAEGVDDAAVAAELAAAGVHLAAGRWTDRGAPGTASASATA